MKRKKQKSVIKPNDIKLFIAVILFLMAVLLKYSTFTPFTVLRYTLASSLNAGVSAEDVVEVFSQITKDEKDDYVIEVFKSKILGQSIDPSYSESEEY